MQEAIVGLEKSYALQLRWVFHAAENRIVAAENVQERVGPLEADACSIGVDEPLK